MCQEVRKGRFSARHHRRRPGRFRSGFVEDGATGVGEHVNELTLMDRAGRFRGAVAADVAGEGELLEKSAHPSRLGFVGIESRCSCVEGRWGRARRGHMARPEQVDSNSRSVGLDQPVCVGQMNADQGFEPQVAEQPVFLMSPGQAFAQQGVVLEVDHATAQVVGRAHQASPAEFSVAGAVSRERIRGGFLSGKWRRGDS